MEIPLSLRRLWRGQGDWLRRLPSVVEELAMQWDLQLEEPLPGAHSLVVPAGEVVLKITPPGDRDADQESEALDAWNGQGAVRLIARNDEERALLLERCRPGTRLWDDRGADDVEVATGLLNRLTIELPVGHGLRKVDDERLRWAEDLKRRYVAADSPFERSLLDHAVEVFVDAPSDPGEAFLVNQDLHGGNVLRASREPWLVIDPKPLAGEREVAAVGLLRNAASGSNFSPAGVARWLDALAGLGLDRERLRGWGVAHALAWGYDEAGWIDWSIEVARTIRAA